MTRDTCVATLPLTEVADSAATAHAARAPTRQNVDARQFEWYACTYRADLFRFAFWLTRDAAVAEDAVQEALLRAWQAWPRLRDRAAVKQWLLTIVRRECARTYERKRYQTTDVDDLTAAEEYLIAVEDDSTLCDVQQAILSLDESYREPLVLQVLMGYSTQEIANIMGIKQGAVLTRLCRARQKLAEQIQDRA